MNNGSKYSRSSGGWVRITWAPDSGIVLVSGDSAGLLGVSARRLINSPDPLTLLPAELAGILSNGLPEAPVQVTASPLTGTVVSVNDRAEILLFDAPDLQGGGNIMLDELGAGVVVTDRTGNIVLWNKAMTSIFRIPKQHVMGKQLQDVLASPVLYSWENVIQMVLDGKQIRVECHLDGQRRVDSTFSLGGEGVIGTCFDTTESFQAENRLRTSRKMNQAYFHSVSTGLVLFDRDYRILVANRAFGRMFGLVENLLGIHLNEILPRESLAIVEDQTRILFNGFGNKENEIPRIIRFVLPDETRRVISQNIKPIVEESGDIFYAVGIFEDVSEKSILLDRYNAYQNRIKEISRLASTFSSDQSDNLKGIPEVLRECFSAEAIAVYLSDPLGDIVLVGKTEKWPEAAPESFADLRLATFMLDSHSRYQLNGDEIGVLNSWFR
ncbi:MAG: PAS domain-containing protein, partial [Candidatus Fermentibacteraceae bacterium]|nr:PAS domain-containing protein [Candidatus Fermentibacteraceae bacterium]